MIKIAKLYAELDNTDDQMECVMITDEIERLLGQTMNQEEKTDRITDLEAQVATLKKIAIKETASGLFNGPWDSGLPDDCGYDAEIEACRTEARRQLAKEHPEIDWR